MKAFEYAAPHTEDEALALLSPNRGRTELLAGGTDLLGLMKRSIVAPDRVVNIDGIQSMRSVAIDPDTGELSIGAVAHLDDLLETPHLADFPAIRQAIQGINSPQLQSQGTIGGELCRRPMCWYFRGGHGLLADAGRRVVEGDNRYHAILGNTGPAKFVHPSRVAPALISLGARVRIIGPAERDDAPPTERAVPLEDFFRTPRHDHERETILAPDELLTHVIVPSAAGRASATYEVRQSVGPDMPLAAAAATLRIVAGVVREAKIVLGQVAPTPWISAEAAHAIVGQCVTEYTAEAAGHAAVARATPLSHNEYKVQLARVAVQRAILLAAGLNPGGF